MNYLEQTKVQILIFALVIAVFYGNTLTNGFVHDDVWQVQTNNNIKSIQSIPKIFSGCIGEDLVGKCNERGYYYRPLQNISYLITYQISQDPWVFHLANLILLFILSCVIYLFFKLLLGKWELAFLGTILFLINPIISEVVNWVSAVPEFLMSIFIICSLIFAFKFNKSAKITQFVLSLVFLFLALLSKETAVFLSPLILVVMFFKVPSQRLVVLWTKNFKILLAFLVPLTLYFLIRNLVLGKVVYEYEGYYAMSGFEQMLNAFYFYGKYTLKLISPLPLSFQELILPVKEINFGVFLGGALGILNLGFILFFFRKNLKVLSFALLMISLSILPALIFINKIGEFLFSERYLFFASIGYSLFLIELLRFSLTPQGWKAKGWLGRFGRLGGLGVLGILGVACFFIVFNRNKDWKDNTSSYSAMIRLDPSYARAYFQRGELYLSQGSLPPAKKDYESALRNDSQNEVVKDKLANFPKLFRAKNGIEFLVPKTWKVSESSDLIKIESTGKEDERLHIEMILRLASLAQDDKESYGKLINEGKALIPGWDEAFVKVWEEESGQGTGDRVQKLEFFLFKNDKVIKVLVNPVDSPSMSQLDNILGSIKLY